MGSLCTCASKFSTSRDGASPSQLSLVAEVTESWRSGTGGVSGATEWNVTCCQRDVRLSPAAASHDVYKRSIFFLSSSKSFHPVAAWKMCKTQQVEEQLHKSLIWKGSSPMHFCSLGFVCFHARGETFSSIKNRFLGIPLTQLFFFFFFLGRSDKPCPRQSLLQVQADEDTGHQCLRGNRQRDLRLACFLCLQHGGQALSELPQVSWRSDRTGLVQAFCKVYKKFF